MVRKIYSILIFPERYAPLRVIEFVLDKVKLIIAVGDFLQMSYACSNVVRGGVIKATTVGTNKTVKMWKYAQLKLRSNPAAKL